MNELLKFPSDFVSDQFVKFMDEKEIDELTTKLANEVSERYLGEELILVGVLKGSVIFLTDLVKKIKGVKVYLDFVQLDSIGRTKENTGTIYIKKDLTSDIYNKNVLIVEEIIDTGRALQFLKSRIKLSSPKSLEVLTLLDKPYQRIVQIAPDYVGKKIEEQFVIGYGLDLDQYGRNIRDFYFLKYPN